MVPIDKASGNVAFVCKRFYLKVLLDELGYGKATPNATYEQVTTSVEDIKSKHIRFLTDKFKLKQLSSESKLPNIYWLPKMHKTPIKFRFIIAAPDCTIKPLAKSLTSIFSLFYKQIESYNKKCSFFSGVNTFWVIQNNQPVIKAIKKINDRRQGRSVETFDFSTLYTKIPHIKLTDVLCKMVDFCFSGGNSKSLLVNTFGARWVENPRSAFVYTKKKVKLALRYLMSNCYFTLGSKTFRQIIGIPMGSDPAPFFANLFLYYYESKWLRNIQKSDLSRARKFKSVFRFIDDLLSLNDGGEFSRSLSEIYPEELELSKENVGTLSSSFLDIHIKLSDRQFSSKLFDKRDNFNFSIVRMPHTSSTIPSAMVYSAFSAEILRIARVTSALESFTKSAKDVVDRMAKQGADQRRMKNSIGRLYAKHLDDFCHITNDATILQDMFM